MSTLPIEVIREIFIIGCDLELLADPFHELAIYTYRKKPFVRRLLGVCRLWRAIAEDPYFRVVTVLIRLQGPSDRNETEEYQDEEIEHTLSMADTEASFLSLKNRFEEPAAGTQVDFCFELFGFLFYRDSVVPEVARMEEWFSTLSEWLDQHILPLQGRIERMRIRFPTINDPRRRFTLVNHIVRKLYTGRWSALRALWCENFVFEGNEVSRIDAPELYTVHIDGWSNEQLAIFPIKNRRRLSTNAHFERDSDWHSYTDQQRSLTAPS